MIKFLIVLGLLFGGFGTACADGAPSQEPTDVATPFDIAVEFFDLTCENVDEMFVYNDEVEVVLTNEEIAVLHNITKDKFFTTYLATYVGEKGRQYLRSLAFKVEGNDIVVTTGLFEGDKGYAAADGCDFQSGEFWFILNLGEPLPPPSPEGPSELDDLIPQT